MTDREKLIELLCDAPLGSKTFEQQYYKSTITKIADYLINNGVIVPPCPIGTKIYMLVTKRARLNLPPFTFIKDSKLTFHNIERVIEDFGKTVFLTRKEAEQALKEKVGEVRCLNG